MKKIIFLFVLGSYSLCIHAQNNSDKEPYLTKSLSKETIKDVQVKTLGGSISVSGVNSSEAKIEVYVQPNNYKSNPLSKAEIQKRLNEDYEFNIDVSNNTLTAIAKAKDRNMDWKNALNISFKVFVGENVSTDLHTSGGSISLIKLTGNQGFSTSGGSLHVNNVTGKIDGKTSGGSIHISNSKNDISLNTSGGSIVANNCSGKIKLRTSGGSLKLKDLKGDITANTSGGSINGNNIDGELISHTSGGSIHLDNMSGSLETSTSGGHIDVAITTLGKYVKIHNSGGNVDLQIPNKGIDLDLSASRIRTDALNNFSGTKDDDEIKGKLNSGGVPVTVRSSSGTIHLTIK